MRSVNAEYDPEAYWTDVAEQIARRGAGNVVASDHELFQLYRRDRFIERFLKRMAVNGRSVLELGCGPGGNLLVLHGAQPARLVGCDISTRMAELARSNTAGTGTEIVRLAGPALPFDDGEFEIGFTATVLQHNVDDTAVSLMSEMCRVAARRIFLFEETMPWRREIFSNVHRPPRFYQQAMAANGFAMVRTEALYDLVSRTLTAISRRALNRQHQQGAPKSRASRVAESALMRVGRPLDQVVRIPIGLRMMVFERLR